MSVIDKAELFFVDLRPQTPRTDSIQSFVSQETPIVKITDSDGATGIGYCYTIGTGGSSVCALLIDHLLPKLIGQKSDRIEHIWSTLKFSTNATMVGPMTALALAAIDTALWDLRCKRTELPLHLLAGGARSSAQLYSTECGWLHLSIEELADGVLETKQAGFSGAKIKVGKPTISEDCTRLEAVRSAVGDEFELMIDCNQAFTRDEAVRRAKAFETFQLAWIEEPLPADDIQGHSILSQSTSIPVAIGESLYSIGQFSEYLRRDACSIVQVDVARVGGITPWLKVAHAAECLNVAVAPHFLMEIHTSLVCATQGSRWVEYIPQLDEICRTTLTVKNGEIFAPSTNDIGIDWDWSKIEERNLLSAGSNTVRMGRKTAAPAR